MSKPPYVPKVPAHFFGLTEQQRKFVKAFVEFGNYTRAAEEAGYGGDSASYKQRGYELMTREKIKAAIQIEQREKGGRMISIALKAMEGLLGDPDPSIKLRAAKDVLDRFGMGKVTQSEVLHKHEFSEMSETELRAYVTEQMTLRLKDVRAEAEDAKFEEVEGPAEDEPADQNLEPLVADTAETVDPRKLPMIIEADPTPPEDEADALLASMLE